MSSALFADELGPRGKRRVAIATVWASLAIVGALVVAFGRLSSRDQFEGELWEPFTDPDVLRFLAGGLGNTVRVAAVAMVLALALGTVLALARLARLRPLRWAATGVIEFFRAYPLLLLIIFTAKLLSQQEVEIGAFWYLVIALMLYNGSILAEIFRAGILSLDRGQGEAASAIGLGYWQTMGLVLVPQAVRRMSPAIVSQLITLLKDTALGFIIFYDELLRRSRAAGNEFNNPLQFFVMIALVYIAINLVLSRVARRLEVRQRRRLGGGAISVAGVEDLAVMDAVSTGAPKEAGLADSRP
ncbi:amino acid ABC transporter permease [soil metagenome]